MASRILPFVFGLAHAVSPAPQNRAAWLTAPATPFAVQEAAYPSPLSHEIVIRSAAVAINPVDWKVQYGSTFPITYPHILGEDVAGEVVEVGDAVDSIKVGDRVVAYAQGLGTRDSRNGAFQLYAAVPQVLTSKIPDSLSYTDGVVLPLGIATAAAGLFQKGYLELPLPGSGAANGTDAPLTAKKVVLVWGGSSSVGTSAIQLAIAAGIRVATTASPRNHDYVKDLGAEWAFDYRSSTVVDDIVAALKGLELVGVYDAIGDDPTLNAAVAVVNGLADSVSTKVVTVNGFRNEIKDGVKILGFSAAAIGKNEVGPAIFQDFLPSAIQDGLIKPKPTAWVVAEDLEGVQGAVDESRSGVSAQKIVVKLAPEDSTFRDELKI
ncbi:NADPH quinone reductase [Thozetella sp. PMI_491]|nr:NADPH quinone reductase [Thozetella sp. PMI_491]